ncbi:MAG: DUF502 domain-containing protein [Isosphaeraceae bacterium]
MTTTPPHPPLDEMGAVHALLLAIRNRILSGLFLVLPAILTFVILGYLYQILTTWVLNPVASMLVRLANARLNLDGTLPDWWIKFFSPLLAIALILSILYLLGYLVRSRLFQLFDAILLRVPVVTTVYKGVSGVVSSLQGDGGMSRFQRVVLVPFPHAGSRALAFVTRTLRDEATGRKILCVCLLTGVVPPAGFTLFVPEEEVTEVDWTIDQTLQAILTGGLTTPPTIPYFPRAEAEQGRPVG